MNLNRRIPLHNNGIPIRNWLHAQDTADAIIKIINEGVTNEIYNICGGFEQNNLTTVKKIIDLLFNDKNIDKYIDTDYHRIGQDMRYAIDDSKLRNLGWESKKLFNDELFLIVEYYKKKFIW